MMKCPDCGEELRCHATRTPATSGNRWLQDMGLVFPAMIVRRRRCPTHGLVMTVELPAAAMLAVVAQRGEGEVYVGADDE
jgi:hypothetical protein